MKEKELIINGIKYVRVDEKKEYKVGDIVKYNNYNWYVIKVNNDDVTLMMKDVLDEEKIKKYFTDESYLDDDNDVIFNIDKTNFDWNDTYIKKVLNSTFLEEFNREELNLMKTNYDEDKYSEDYIRIPTIREIERLDINIRRSNQYYWTMSPYYFSSVNASALVWHVTSTGNLSNNSSTNGNGVRPVINLKQQNKYLQLVNKMITCS